MTPLIELKNLRFTKPSLPYDVRVDRSSILGNPYRMELEKERDNVCNLYESYFYENLGRFSAELDRLISLALKYGRLRLFCWCAPKRCHAETIKKFIENKLATK